MYGGVKCITSHITSNPAPEELVKARRSIFIAVGLLIAMVAAGAVQYIYRRNQLMFNKLPWLACGLPPPYRAGMVGKRARRAYQVAASNSQQNYHAESSFAILGGLASWS